MYESRRNPAKRASLARFCGKLTTPPGGPNIARLLYGASCKNFAVNAPLRQVRKAQSNRHAGHRAAFLKVSSTFFGKVRSSTVRKLPLEPSADHKWHRITPSLALGPGVLSLPRLFDALPSRHVGVSRLDRKHNSKSFPLPIWLAWQSLTAPVQFRKSSPIPEDHLPKRLYPTVRYSESGKRRRQYSGFGIG